MTHILCWNMQRLFKWSEDPSWKIGLTSYVGTCKGCLSEQDIFSEKSEALNSPPMLDKGFLSDQDILRNLEVLDSPTVLEHAKVFCVIRTFPPEKSKAVDSQAMLEHTKVVWVIRTFLLRNQRHWTHQLCWNMQRLFEWSGQLLRNQRYWTHMLCWNMQRLFEWSRHPSWEIRSTRLTNYIGICKGCLGDQDIPPKKSETGLTTYVGTCKGYSSDQDIPPGKLDALDSHPMLGHAKVVWVIRTTLLRNQRHWTHLLY